MVSVGLAANFSENLINLRLSRFFPGSFESRPSERYRPLASRFQRAGPLRPAFRFRQADNSILQFLGHATDPHYIGSVSRSSNGEGCEVPLGRAAFPETAGEPGYPGCGRLWSRELVESAPQYNCTCAGSLRITVTTSSRTCSHDTPHFREYSRATRNRWRRFSSPMARSGASVFLRCARLHFDDR